MRLYSPVLVPLTEGVIQTEPVTRLMDGGQALVVACLVAAGNSRGQDSAAIIVEVRGPRIGCRWEVAVA